MRILYPSVNTRIIGPFLLAIIVIAGLGVFIVTQLVVGSVQERFSNQLLDSAFAAANTVVEIEREKLSVLRQMAFTEGVAQAVQTGQVDDLDRWLRPIAANNTIDSFIIFDDAGKSLLYLQLSANNEYSTPDLPDVSQWASVQRTLDGESDLLGDKFVEIATVGTDRVFYFSGPIINADARIVGGILLGIPADEMVRRLEEVAIAAVALTDANGALFASTFRTNEDNFLNLNPENLAIYQEAVSEESIIQEITLESTPYQVLYAGFQMRSQAIGLLAVGLRSNFIVEQSTASRDTVGLLFTGFFFAVAFLGLFIARTITDPIRRLVNTTRAIREGDLTRRVQLKTSDELGELSQSFDTMTDQLVATNYELESLFKQREAVLTSINDAVFVLDMSGKIILRNDTAITMQDSIMTDELFYGRFRQIVGQSPQNLYESSLVSFGEMHYNVFARPVQTSDKSLLGYVVVFHDITPLITSEKLKDELVLQMSHELRTPLAAVRGYVDLLQMIEGGKLSEQGMGFMDSARDQLGTLERLVNQVIDVSEIIADRFLLDIESFNLSYLLNESFSHWKTIMAERDHHLFFSLTSDEIYIEADRRRIQEIMDYLMHNAFSYTLPGGLIGLQAGVIDGSAVIAIKDNGVGIAEDEMNKVFERMYRGRSAEAGATDTRGMGMGLYITRKIVEAHHGEIMLESKPGKGTTVTVRLPLIQSSIEVAQ